MNLSGAGAGYPVWCQGPASKERPAGTRSLGAAGGGGVAGEVVVYMSVADQIYRPPPCAPPSSHSLAPPPLLSASIRKDRTTDSVSSRSQSFGGVFGLTLLKLFPKTNGMLLNFPELWGNGPGGGGKRSLIHFLSTFHK